MASLPFIRAIASTWKDREVWVSTVTSTGQVLARQKAEGAKGTFYLPYDLPWSVYMAVRRFKPSLFITMETEIWPNLLWAMHSKGVPKALVNGRISDRSYPRYLALKGFFREVIGCIELFCMQSEESARRVLELGAPANKVHVVGNMKFDLPCPQADPKEWLDILRIPQGVPVIVGGSLHQGEEGLLLEVFRELSQALPDLRLILAPRRPERFKNVEVQCWRLGIPVQRRTGGANAGARVILLDTIGELSQIYCIASVAFVGGSLVPKGGHNPLEAAIFGKPVLFGPHMENFREISEALISRGGARMVRDKQELICAMRDILMDRQLAGSMGEKAKGVIEENRGATSRTLELLKGQMR